MQLIPKFSDICHLIGSDSLVFMAELYSLKLSVI